MARVNILLKPSSFVFLLILTLAACTSTPAPVVEGWKQPPEASDYRVQEGDSVYSIAWAFALDYRDLVRWNHLTEPYSLHQGQVLHMSSTTAGQPARSTSAPVSSIVRPAVPATVAGAAQPKTTSSNMSNTIKPMPPSARQGNWQWPTRGRVTHGFSPATGAKGIDISGQVGQPVVAVSDGKVVYAGASLPGYGNLIILKHNDNQLSAYAYNKVIAVKEGQVVKAGQRIAQMGKNDEGKPMLHFEIRQNGKPVNPLPFLKQEK